MGFDQVPVLQMSRQISKLTHPASFAAHDKGQIEPNRTYRSNQDIYPQLKTAQYDGNAVKPRMKSNKSI